MNRWNDISGLNSGYIAELYERFLQNRNAVDEATRDFFRRWNPPSFEIRGTPVEIRKVVAAVNLADSIRKFGYLEAGIDPLGSRPSGDPSLKLETHGLTEDDLRKLPASVITGSIPEGEANALEVIGELRRIYCSTAGFDFAHLRDPDEREWLRQSVEERRFRPPSHPIDPEGLLRRLTEVEVFARFLHHTFPGKSRFSGEGLDILIPILDELTTAAAETGTRNILIGMAHRARVNVMAHVLHKPYAQIFAEFKDPLRSHKFRDDLGWTGDVTYHAGGRTAMNGGEPIELVITIPANPSHLEAVDPVLEGMARAAGTDASRPGPPCFDSCCTLPVLIHGDASFAGQGVVAETFNLARLEGYATGGTMHIIANNQLGYTATPAESRSTLFASDLARGFKIPIVHVNADDPEGCIEAARMAFAYRDRFRKDFLIDLVGYRRHGHNEGDEPRFTQPEMYRLIDRHPTVRDLWTRTLVSRGIIEEDLPEKLVRERMKELQAVWNASRPDEELVEPVPPLPPPRAAHRAATGVPIETLKALNEAILEVPEGFSVNPKLGRARESRARVLDEMDEPSVSWATAEDLALASILADGIPVRMTGQDVERGTFSQRHAVLHDSETGEKFTPLESIPQAGASFEIHNSPLTENAAIGFEHGYSIQAPERLVIWEAQYGDFINEAQVMIDEFLLSARAKWGTAPSLVLLLPHGYEGHGPDHSSARLERFLQLSAETNVRVAVCTTAAQYFHLLRLHASLLKVDPLPLVILTAKSLLRHPRVASSPRELAEGRWKRVIDDVGVWKEKVRRLILCAGKIHVDLVTSELRDRSPGVALGRLEQLAPFPQEELAPVLDSYPDLEEVVWVQEEPENMGAWEYVRPELVRLIRGRWPLRYVGRDRSSSPAEGSAARHQRNQRAIIERAFSPALDKGQEDMVLTENP